MKVDLLDLRDRAKDEAERECVTDAACECFSRCAALLRAMRRVKLTENNLVSQLGSFLQEKRSQLPGAVTAGLSDEQLAACLVHTAYSFLLPRSPGA